MDPNKPDPLNTDAALKPIVGDGMEEDANANPSKEDDGVVRSEKAPSAAVLAW